VTTQDSSKKTVIFGPEILPLENEAINDGDNVAENK
jgi:hypothetical protein